MFLSESSYAPTNVLSLAQDPPVDESRLGDVYFNVTTSRLRVFAVISQTSFGFGAYGGTVFGGLNTQTQSIGWQDVAPSSWDDLERPAVIAAGSTRAEALAQLGFYVLGPNDPDDDVPIGSVIIRRSS